MKKFLVAASALAVILTGPGAHAQSLATVTLNLQYREPLGSADDLAAARARIMTQADKDSTAASKALGLRCNINGINFNNNGAQFIPPGQIQQIGPVLFGNVNAQCAPESGKP